MILHTSYLFDGRSFLCVDDAATAKMMKPCIYFFVVGGFMAKDTLEALDAATELGSMDGFGGAVRSVARRSRAAVARGSACLL